jgi:hypothetical protein
VCLTSAGKRRLVGRLAAGADEQSNAWGSIAGLLEIGSYSVKRRPSPNQGGQNPHFYGLRTNLNREGGKTSAHPSTLFYLPESCTLIAELQQTVLGIMWFAAMGAFQITAPRCALPIVVFGDGKSRATTARYHKHLEPFFIGLRHLCQVYSLAPAWHCHPERNPRVRLRTQWMESKDPYILKSPAGVGCATITNSGVRGTDRGPPTSRLLRFAKQPLRPG